MTGSDVQRTARLVLNDLASWVNAARSGARPGSLNSGSTVNVIRSFASHSRLDNMLYIGYRPASEALMKQKALRQTILAAVLSLVTLFGAADSRSYRPQSCNPAVVSCLVLDENGNLLSEAELKSIQDKLPKSIGDADVFIDQVSLAEDGKSFYWPESVDFEKGKKIPSLNFVNARTCTMHLTEVTLTYHDKSMRLIFNIEIERRQDDRRPVIRLLPFQEGTFELDLTGWGRERDRIIPTERWKKVKGKA